MRHVISVLYGRVLGAQTFTLLVNPFRVFVRVPELAGDARQWWQLGLCLCSLTEQTDAARSTAYILDALPASVRRLALFTDMLSNSDML